ncbi:MAG: amidohydrolase family protein [Candidatus Limnocylindrales bacterium]
MTQTERGVNDMWRLPSTFLPDGDERDLWVDKGRFSTNPVDGAEMLPGRFVLPGLVDAHAHVALANDQPVGAPEALLGLHAMARAGVLLVRDVGAPGSVTLDIALDSMSPEFLPAGRWLAPAGRFFEAYHEPVPADALITAALAEVARGARWIKVVADWDTHELSYDPALLRDLIRAVHAAGARITAHIQWTRVGEVVAAGIDSIEHGCLIDDATIEVMAANGVAWTPTLTAFNQPLPEDAPAKRRARVAQVLDNYRRQIPQAAARGVTILAGTDTAGTVVDEIRQLIAYGLGPVQALRAASTNARRFLGLPSFEADGPGDLTTYTDDPREDPEVLARPVAVLRHGIRIA